MSNKKEPKLSEILDVFIDRLHDVNKSIEELDTLKKYFEKLRFNLSNTQINPDLRGLESMLNENLNSYKNVSSTFLNNLTEINKQKKRIDNNQFTMYIISILISCFTTIGVIYFNNKTAPKLENRYFDIEHFFNDNPKNFDVYKNWKVKNRVKKDSINNQVGNN